MASTPPSSPTGAVVVDANVAVAIVSKESARESKASSELSAYSSKGFSFYAPGAIISETLFVLCRKHADGFLPAADYAQAVIDFELLMAQILPPPNGDASLISRAAAIADGYGCSRTADALYIALAEELGASMSADLVTFDADLPNQAARN